jgi:hypothetical protein
MSSHYSLRNRQTLVPSERVAEIARAHGAAAASRATGGAISVATLSQEARVQELAAPRIDFSALVATSAGGGGSYASAAAVAVKAPRVLELVEDEDDMGGDGASEGAKSTAATCGGMEDVEAGIEEAALFLEEHDHAGLATAASSASAALGHVFGGASFKAVSAEAAKPAEIAKKVSTLTPLLIAHGFLPKEAMALLSEEQLAWLASFKL